MIEFGRMFSGFLEFELCAHCIRMLYCGIQATLADPEETSVVLDAFFDVMDDDADGYVDMEEFFNAIDASKVGLLF